MSRTKLVCVVAAALCAGISSCSERDGAASQAPAAESAMVEAADPVAERAAIYAPFTLTADLSGFNAGQRKMLGLLIEASKIMDRLFWLQAYGDPATLLDSLDAGHSRKFAEINYGPWDRLNGDAPMLAGAGRKPLGANFYPHDMTQEEFEAADLPGKRGLYSLIRRDDAGNLTVVPYHVAYAEELGRAAELLRAAAEHAENEEFASYLRLRADALVTDDYQPSDLAWMDMKSNPVELVIGAIETYEDQLFGYRAAYESYVLIKDPAWSERLSKFAAFLPELQQGLPVPKEYKSETPGTDSDLNAYDAIYYAGHSNAGSKTIAINLPNDEEVQLAKGTRRLQLKNAMQAKFDTILAPIAGELIVEEQRRHVTFDAFFANTMFHEVAHGLGIKNTVNGTGTVRNALLEHASSMEEGKADVLGLYMITRLREQGEFDTGSIEDNYVTFLASIFRSVRFGASSAHGRANMVRFNFFEDRGAFTRDSGTGRYRVDFDAMKKAMDALSGKILTLQGDGDYAGVSAFIEEMGVIRPGLEADLARLGQAGIPVDIVFEQGAGVLGLKR